MEISAQMSLRLRLVASTVLVLVLSLGLGAGLAAVRATRSVRTELGAAMEVGGQTIRNGVAELAESPNPAADAARLITTFDGNRHLRAVLLNAPGALIAQSHPMLSDPPVPQWFLWLVGPKLATERTAIPAAGGGGAILLQPKPANEVGEVWASLGDNVVELGVFCLLTSALIFGTTGRTLRPLGLLSNAFARIGAGDYTTRVPPGGPSELVLLAHGFNRMAEQLAAMTAQNQRLHEQLLTLQDEERADLARDLHDEIGPFLFSVNVTAASIDRLVAGGQAAEIPAQVVAIREAVGHMQKHVRAILGRLRPIRAIEFGLQPAVEDLVVFWRSRHPNIAFDVVFNADIAELGDAVQEVAYRVAQESLSNAIRHGHPGRVEVAIGTDRKHVTVRVSDDGQGAETPAATGFGLAGMRERVAALGGTLITGPRGKARGWEVIARLPQTVASAEQMLADP